MSSAGPGRREVAHRIFAAEYDDATLEYAESDEERAPNYVVTPAGARVNRLFVVGVLTAVEQVNDDTVRARIADPTGAYVIYAGQYQPDELAALQSLESPAFVAVTGKANTFSPEGSDRVLTSVRPESVTEVDAETRDRWVAATAEHTLARIQTAADALGREERGEALRAALIRDGVEPGLAEGIAKALDHYETTADYLGALRDLATQALEVVAGERSEVDPLELAPEEGDGTVSAGDLSALLDEERLGVTRGTGDVDPEVLLEGESEETDSSGADEETTESAEADEVDGESGDAGGTGEDEAPSDAEPETSERAAEATADDAERAAEEDEGAASEEPEPETSEAAAEETAADAIEAASDEGVGEDVDDGDGDADGGSDADDAADPDDELYEIDDEEREEIEEEYGVDFQSGTEVEPAGQAGIEAEGAPPAEDEPDGEVEGDGEDAVAEASADTSAETSAGEAEEQGADSESGEEDSEEDGEEEEGEGDEEAVDLEAALLDEMDDLDEGDGADREALIDSVADETGADADAVDDAIDDLLMSGQCYEPSEGTLKPI